MARGSILTNVASATKEALTGMLQRDRYRSKEFRCKETFIQGRMISLDIEFLTSRILKL